MSDVIMGSIKLKGFIEEQCFTSLKEFIASLPNILVAEIPSEATNVVVSSQQPSNDQRDAVWFRLDNSGSFVGIYIYSKGSWKQITPAPNEVIRMWGDSRSVPSGYALIDASNPNFTSSELAAIQSSWVRDSTDTYWKVFDVTFQGF